MPASTPGRDARLLAALAAAAGAAIGVALTLLVVVVLRSDDGGGSDRLLAAMAGTFAGASADGLVRGTLTDEAPAIFHALTASGDVLASMRSPSPGAARGSNFAWFQVPGTPEQALERVTAIVAGRGWVEPPARVTVMAAPGASSLLRCAPADEPSAALFLSAAPIAGATVVSAQLTYGAPLGANPCAAPGNTQ